MHICSKNYKNNIEGPSIDNMKYDSMSTATMETNIEKATHLSSTDEKYKFSSYFEYLQSFICIVRFIYDYNKFTII